MLKKVYKKCAKEYKTKYLDGCEQKSIININSYIRVRLYVTHTNHLFIYNDGMGNIKMYTLLNNPSYKPPFTHYKAAADLFTTMKYFHKQNKIKWL